MTLNTPDSIVTYTGNGTETVFQYGRKFISNSHVFVTLDGTLTTAYTITGAGNEAGGTITFSTAPGSGVRVVIYRQVPFTQETDLENFDGNPAVVHENQLDLIVMQTQNLDERVDRAITAPVDDVNVSLVLPKAATRANGYPYFGPSGEILVTTDSVGVSTAAAAASASAADASADAAALSAAAASAAASSAMWSNVVFLTSASSPYTVTSGNSGDLLSIDTSGGAVVITLPQISTLTLPFNLGIKKTTADSNSVTINRSGTDTIGASATSKSLINQDQGCTLVADTDPAPDQWAVGDFGLVTQSATILSNSGYFTNMYYTGFGYFSSTDSSFTADIITATPFIVPVTTTFTKIGINITSAGTNARLGIYNFSNGLPTTLVLDAGSISVASLGEKEIVISQSLTAGIYALAVNFSATTSAQTADADGTGVTNYFLGFLNGLTGTGQMSARMSSAFGAMPASFTLSSYGTSSQTPIVWLRK